MSAEAFRVGVGLVRDVPDDHPGYVAAAARLAEQLGFADLWISDHPAFPVAMPDPLVAAATAGAATTRIGICLGIVQLGLRHPVVLAKAVSSLAAELGDRLLVGLAVGGDHHPEWDAFGIPPSERVGRFVEALPLFLDLLAGQPVHHAGPYFTFDCPPLRPRSNRPSVWIGSRPGAAATRSLQVDGWLAMFRKPTALAAEIERLAEAARTLGRPAPQVGIALTGSIAGSHYQAACTVTTHFARAYGSSADEALRAGVVGLDD